MRDPAAALRAPPGSFKVRSCSAPSAWNRAGPIDALRQMCKMQDNGAHHCLRAPGARARRPGARAVFFDLGGIR